MNWLFRRHFWIVHLLFICITAGVLALTAASLFGYWLMKSVPEKPPKKVFVAKKEIVEENDYELVSDQNIFSARREVISFDEPNAEAALTPNDWRESALSRLPLKLVSTMVFNDPYQSRATILDTSTGKTSVHTVRECQEYKKTNSPNIETVLPPSHWIPERSCKKIGSYAQVERIEENKVYLLDLASGIYSYLELGMDKKIKPVIVESKQEGSGIRKVGEHSYQIEQKALDNALSNVTRLMLDARAMPKDDGKGNFEGYQLTYIKKDSLFQQIGLNEGDILKRINGYELDNPQKAIELFGKLRFADHFTIDIKRKEKPVTLDYSVSP